MAFPAERTKLLVLLSLLKTLYASLSVSSGASQHEGDNEEDPTKKRILKTIYMKTLKGDCVQIDADLLDTVKRLKCQIQMKNGIPPERQGLVFLGRLLKDDRTLLQSGVKEGVTVYLLLRHRGGIQVKVKTASGRLYQFNSSENAREVLSAVENAPSGQSSSLLISLSPVNSSTCKGDKPAPREFEVIRRYNSSDHLSGLQVTTSDGRTVAVLFTATDTIAHVLQKIQLSTSSVQPRRRLDGASGTQQSALTRCPIQVHVRTLMGTRIEGILVCPHDRVARLKLQIVRRLKQESQLLDYDDFDLLFGQQQLEEERTLSEYKIGNDNLVVLVVRLQAQSSAQEAESPAKRRKKDNGQLP